MGWLTRRGNRWYWNWYDHDSGRRIHRWKSTRTGNRRLAERIGEKWELDRIAAMHGLGLDATPDRDALTWSVSPPDALESYLHGLQGRLSDAWLREQGYHLRPILRCLLGLRWTHQDISDLLSRMKDEGRASRTCNKVRSMLRGFCSFALSAGMAAGVNPVDSVPRFDIRDARERSYLTREQYARLVSVASGDIADLIVLAYRTGLRKMELLTLHGRDINLAENAVIVQGKDGWKPKTRRSRRVPLHPEALSVVRRRKLADDAPLFPGRTGHRLDVRRAFDQALKAAGLPRTGPDRINFHSIRHGYAMLLAQSVPIQVVREAMGHADIQSTMQYVHDFPDQVRDAILSAP